MCRSICRQNAHINAELCTRALYVRCWSQSPNSNLYIAGFYVQRKQAKQTKTTTIRRNGALLQREIQTSSIRNEMISVRACLSLIYIRHFYSGAKYTASQMFRSFRKLFGSLHSQYCTCISIYRLTMPSTWLHRMCDEFVSSPSIELEFTEPVLCTLLNCVNRR